jgi:hypothetical protein
MNSQNAFQINTPSMENKNNATKAPPKKTPHTHFGHIKKLISSLLSILNP